MTTDKAAAPVDTNRTLLEMAHDAAIAAARKAAAPVGAVPQDLPPLPEGVRILSSLQSGTETVYFPHQMHEYAQAALASQAARIAELEKDAARLDFIERTYSGMTNRERYLPVQMVWGKGAMGRTLREACDKYMKKRAAIDALLRADGLPGDAE